MTRPEPLPDQWFSRDLLVLREVARAFADNPNARPNCSDIAAGLDMDEPTVAAVGQTLVDAGFVEGINTDWGLAAFTKLTPAGRREVGLWPSPETAADRLLAALEQAIDRADGEQKTRLQKIRDGLAGAGRDVIVGIATGVITGQIGS